MVNKFHSIFTKILLLIFLQIGASITPDHLIFTKIAISPVGAEMVVIENPTNTNIVLNDYYITDATNNEEGKLYYNLPTGDDFWSGGVTDFIARFPQMTLLAGESIILSMHSDEIYSAYYEYDPDLALFGDMLNAIEGDTTISIGPIFNNIGMLSQVEMLIMFYWDGTSSVVQDVDYFLWGNINPNLAIDKTGVPGYADDTAIEEQTFMPLIQNNMIYFRSNLEEYEDETVNGNGITGHNETNENFPEGWQIIPNLGATTLISEILTGFYEVGTDLTIQGLIVDYDNPFNGPQVITIEDPEGYRLPLIIWDWDVPSSDISYLIENYNISDILIQVWGELDYYISWQMIINSETDILVIEMTGCIDPNAINYNPNATEDDGGCEYYPFGDLNQDMVLDILDIVRMIYIIMGDPPSDYELWAGDTNEDGVIDILDIVWTVDCIMAYCWEGTLGCTDSGANNYDPEATIDDGSCEYEEGTCIDIDNNIYETVIISDQEWMAENLKVTHYRNGEEIPTGYSDSEWLNLNTGAYAVYPWDYDDASQNTCGGDCAEVYGNLYNWYAVDDIRDICPEGWHVPSDNELTDLTDYLGGSSVAGGKMKSTGTIENGTGLWHAPNTGATNESGFTALPGGYRHGNYGYYDNMGYYVYLWSSTANPNQYA